MANVRVRSLKCKIPSLTHGRTDVNLHKGLHFRAIAFCDRRGNKGDSSHPEKLYVSPFYKSKVFLFLGGRTRAGRNHTCSLFVIEGKEQPTVVNQNRKIPFLHTRGTFFDRTRTSLITVCFRQNALFSFIHSQK